MTSSPVPEQILELTGDTPLSVSEQVAILAKTLGREIRCSEVPINAAVEGALRSGVPAEMADAVRESFTAIRDGKAAMVTETVARVLGHPPTSYQTWANMHAGRFV